jgi:hypothetical protein
MTNTTLDANEELDRLLSQLKGPTQLAKDAVSQIIDIIKNSVLAGSSESSKLARRQLLGLDGFVTPPFDPTIEDLIEKNLNWHSWRQHGIMITDTDDYQVFTHWNSKNAREDTGGQMFDSKTLLKGLKEPILHYFRVSVLKALCERCPN